MGITRALSTKMWTSPNVIHRQKTLNFTVKAIKYLFELKKRIKIVNKKIKDIHKE